MKDLFPSFFLWLANATDRQLARQLQFFQAEKRFLPDKRPQHISVNAPKRQRLLSCGKPLGQVIRALIIMVSPRTFARWLSGESARSKGVKSTRPGRLKTPDDLRHNDHGLEPGPRCDEGTRDAFLRRHASTR